MATVPTAHDSQPGGEEATDGQTKDTQEFVPPFPERIDLFSPPKVVIPVVTKDAEPAEEQTEDVAPQTPPALRLLGFVEVEGLKALLTVEGELQVVTIGDSVSGVEIIAVEAPIVTLKHGDNQFQLNLFQQEWFHSAGDTSPAFERGRTFGGYPVKSFQDAGQPGAHQLPELPGLPATGASAESSWGDLPGLPAADPSDLGSLDLPSFDDDPESSVSLDLPRLPRSNEE